MRKLLLLASLTLACGGDDSDPLDPGDGDFTISVVNNAFNPSSLSVPAGSTVTWQWNSSGVLHNVTFEDAAPGSGNLSSGSFDRAFSATGDYAYTCTLHAGMAGLVSVTAAVTGGTGNGGGGGYP